LYERPIAAIILFAAMGRSYIYTADKFRINGNQPELC
jgi:hypothetical protein